jgi:hypothetical protein
MNSAERRQLAVATVDFLARTNHFYWLTKANGDGHDWGTPCDDHNRGVDRVMGESQKTINEAIRALGGLPLTVTVETGASARTTAGAWLGYDPETPGNLLWAIKGVPGESVSLDPSVITELAAEVRTF